MKNKLKLTVTDTVTGETLLEADHDFIVSATNDGGTGSYTVRQHTSVADLALCLRSIIYDLCESDDEMIKTACISLLSFIAEAEAPQFFTMASLDRGLLQDVKIELISKIKKLHEEE